MTTNPDRAPLHSNSLVAASDAQRRPPDQTRFGGRVFLLGAILGYETGPRVGTKRSAALDMFIPRAGNSGVVFRHPVRRAAACGNDLRTWTPAGLRRCAGGWPPPSPAGLMFQHQFESMVKTHCKHGFRGRGNGLTAAALGRPPATPGSNAFFERRYGGYLATFGQGHHTDAHRQSTRGLGTGRGRTQRHRRESPMPRMGLLQRRYRRRVLTLRCHRRGLVVDQIRAHAISTMPGSGLQPWRMASHPAH